MPDDTPVREPLLPCPFCGAAPTLFGEDNAVFKLARVSCEACGAGGPGHFHNRAEAVQAWIRRAALASPPEEEGGEWSYSSGDAAIRAERDLVRALSVPPVREPGPESLCHRCGKPYREHRIGYGAHRCTFAARPEVPEGLVERLQRPPLTKRQTLGDVILDAAEFRELMRQRSEAAAAISVGQNIIADLERRLALAASPPDARPSAPEAPDAQEDGDGG